MMGVSNLADRIRGLALRGLAATPRGESAARRTALTATIRPIDYMRWAEFDSVLRRLSLKDGDRVLDVASPQWLTLSLADANPQVQFTYTNILEKEIAPFRQLASTLGLTNVTFKIEDVRTMTFADEYFDHVLSVSVIEHVFPEVGGDYEALRELRRVIKQNGRLHLTMPYKDRRNVVYVYGGAYERSSKGKQFFAREYDREQFDALIAGSGFAVDGARDFVCEREGLLALDSYSWGPRSNRVTRAAIAAGSMFTERVLGRSFEAALAKRYLSVSPTPAGRLVNVGVTLKKND